jgi:hypothetical protein
VTDESYNIRRKSGVSWKMTTRTSHGTSETSGFTIDNLDTKDINETHGTFETFFVSLRKILENNSSCCLDNEDERLKVCQEFAEFINHNPYYLFSAVKRQRK